ncbi:ribonuclease H-like domain-containing protein [Tanacetum coccineum]
MTPSTLPSYDFLDPLPSSLLTSLASNHTPHITNNTTPLHPETVTVQPIHQGPTSPAPSPQQTMPAQHSQQTTINPPPFHLHEQPQDQPSPQPVNAPPRTHPMITRSQSGIFKPVDRFTWLLVPRPPGVNMVRSMWLFKHKFHADGTLSRYKARLVANRSSQQLGVDFDETFSPVVKSATIRTIFSLVVSRQWPIHQLDVKNAFFDGDLSETVQMYQPPDFVDSRYPRHVCLLQRSLYGLKQVPRAWFQRFAALQLLEHAHMVNCNPSRTPVDTESKLDLSCAVQQVCLYMHDSREPHFAALKCILCYVRGTVDFGLQLYASATTSLVGYTDADWVGCPSTRRSTSGYCVFLGDNLLSWSAKRQHTLFRSSAEAKYRGITNVVAKTVWLRNLLRELHSPLSTATFVYCDNVRVLHVPFRYQYANIFTKGLPSALFKEFRSSLSVHSPLAPTKASFDMSDTKNDTLAIPRPLIGYTDLENIVRLRSKHHKAVIDQGMTLDHGERVESREASQNQYKSKRISYR